MTDDEIVEAMSLCLGNRKRARFELSPLAELRHDDDVAAEIRADMRAVFAIAKPLIAHEAKEATLREASDICREIGMGHVARGFAVPMSRTGREKSQAASRCAAEIEAAILALSDHPTRGAA